MFCGWAIPVDAPSLRPSARPAITTRRSGYGGLPRESELRHLDCVEAILRCPRYGNKAHNMEPMPGADREWPRCRRRAGAALRGARTLSTALMPKSGKRAPRICGASIPISLVGAPGLERPGSRQRAGPGQDPGLLRDQAPHLLQLVAIRDRGGSVGLGGLPCHQSWRHQHAQPDQRHAPLGCGGHG